MFKSFEEMQTKGKEGFEAYVATATAVTKGMQELATQNADFSRKALENGASVAEKVLAAKSFENAVEVQQSFAKESYEAYMGQLSRVGELYTKIAKDAYKPFESQVAEFTGKISGK